MHHPCPLPGNTGGDSTGHPVPQRTTMLLGSMDSTASRNLNCTCWYSRWCSKVKCWTPLLVSSSCMVMPSRGMQGKGGCHQPASTAELLLLQNWLGWKRSFRSPSTADLTQKAHFHLGAKGKRVFTTSQVIPLPSHLSRVKIHTRCPSSLLRTWAWWCWVDSWT